MQELLVLYVKRSVPDAGWCTTSTLLNLLLEWYWDQTAATGLLSTAKTLMLEFYSSLIINCKIQKFRIQQSGLRLLGMYHLSPRANCSMYWTLILKHMFKEDEDMLATIDPPRQTYILHVVSQERYAVHFVILSIRPTNDKWFATFIKMFSPMSGCRQL